MHVSMNHSRTVGRRMSSILGDTDSQSADSISSRPITPKLSLPMPPMRSRFKLELEKVEEAGEDAIETAKTDRVKMPLRLNLNHLL